MTREPKRDKINLLDLSYGELVDLLVEWGQPRFRATQAWRWLYHTLTDNPDEMANLPLDLRRRLVEETHISRLRLLDRVVDEDGLTEKVLLEATDGHAFEAVLMRYSSRNTVCVSSQLGCPVGCLLCATGQSEFVRDLTAGEIAAQVLYFARQLRDENAHVTNVVFMGMGEPLLNFDAVWRAILNLNDREGLALGARRFTISTAGVVPGIERLARESLPVGLAVSLHAPDDPLRDQLIPLNRRYPLERLLQAVRFYVERSGRRVTFEYVLIKDVNDSDDQARRTARLLSGLLCHVNLIPVNPTGYLAYEPPPPDRVLRFQEILVRERIQTTVRASRGTSVQAGCGQLRERYIET
ncbi:MAG: 23S rRNA (adenine(2503)-C(2))-methyltransferase RlmN [Chloroflexi bacterium]|nr:23S rRNA (adenine(2503)-C(2))-methyltransferase RlmN [Chloroflexota bacterium]